DARQKRRRCDTLQTWQNRGKRQWGVAMIQ
ncbi:MAG: hypothetical protein ACI8S3_001980, partial [Alphaproteobacteria bacterium]